MPHPTLSFYRGERPVAVRLPRPRSDGVDCDEEEEVALYVVQLHQRLLPPAALGADAEANHEYYAHAIASSDGLDVLRRNWQLLLALLFVHVPRDACSDDDDDADDDDADTTTTTAVPIRSVGECVRHRLTAADLRGLREPAMMDRVHYSYIVVLRFFGWRIHDDQRGVLDRHRGWRARYALLAMLPDKMAAYRVVRVADDDDNNDNNNKDSAAVPAYGSTNWYASALPHVLHSLLGLGFVTYAVRLADFLVEEMQCGRLRFLHDWLAQAVLQPLYACDAVDASHKRRLRRHYRRLACSDSDDWSSSSSSSGDGSSDGGVAHA